MADTKKEESLSENPTTKSDKSDKSDKSEGFEWTKADTGTIIIGFVVLIIIMLIITGIYYSTRQTPIPSFITNAGNMAIANSTPANQQPSGQTSSQTTTAKS